MQTDKTVIGVDVGTGSARAGIFTADGDMLAHAVQSIQMWRPHPDFAEQSSEDIWSAVCKVVHECLKLSGIPKERVAGISFDATCSLVALEFGSAMESGMLMTGSSSG